MDPEKAKRVILEALREGRITVDQIPPNVRAQLGVDEPQGFKEHFKAEVGKQLGWGRQAAAGVGEVLPTAAIGLANTLEGAGLGALVPEQAEDFEQLYRQRRKETAPEGAGEGTARMIGRMLGEGALGVAAGAPLKGIHLGGRIALNARGAGIAGDVATGSLIAQAGPEESSLGGIAALTGSQALERASENPILRTLAEVGVVFGADEALHAAGRMFNKAVPDKRVPANEARRQEIYDIDQRLNEIAKTSREVEGGQRLYNTELAEIRQGKGDLKTRHLTDAERAEWKSLTLKRKALIEDAVPEGVMEITDNPEILANGLGVWVRQTETDPNVRAKAESAFSGKQGLFPGEKTGKRADPIWDYVASRYLKWVDIDKPYEWIGAGLDLAPAMDPAKLARVGRRSSGAAMRAWEEGLRTFGLNEDPRSPAPKQIIDEYADGDVDALGWVMMAKKEEELRARGDKGKRLTDEQLQAGLDLYNSNAGLRNATKLFKEYAEKFLDMLEEEGLIPEGGAQRVRDEGNFWYAPFKTMDDKASKRLFGNETPGMSDVLRRLERMGHEDHATQYINPVVSWVDYTFEMYNKIAKKRVHTAVADIGEMSLDFGRKGDIVRRAGLIEKIDADEMPSSAVRDGTNEEILTDLGLTEGTGTLKDKEGNYFFRHVNRAGKSDYYKIDKYVHEALRDFQPAEVTGTFWKVFTTPGRTLRTGITITPAFAGANLFRDSIFRALSEPSLEGSFPDSGIAPIAASLGGAFHSIAALFKDAAHKTDIPWLKNVVEDPDFRAMDLSGGTMTSLSGMDADLLVRTLDDMRRNVPGWSGHFYRLRHIGRELGHDMKVLGAISENANRLDTFKRTKQDMLAKGYDELNANIEASYRAGETSVDFSRRGRVFEEKAWAKGLDQATAFWRASIQGWDRTARTVIDIERNGLTLQNAKQLKRLGVVGGTLFSMSLLNYAHNRTNPEYQKISKDVRSRYFLVDVGRIGGYVEQVGKEFIGDDFDMPILQSGSSLFLKVPVPHEFGWLFSTGPIRMLEELDPANAYATGELVDALGQGLDPILDSMRQLIGPFDPYGSSFMGTGAGTAFQMARNRDDFREQDIDPKHMMDLPADVRGSGSESYLAQRMSQGLTDTGFPISPNKIDFAVRSTTGGIGSFAMDQTNRADPNRERTGLTEQGYLRRYFVDERSGGTPASEFYDEYFRLKGHIDASRKYEDQGELARSGRAIGQLTPEEVQKYHAMSVLYDRVRDINGARRAVTNDPELSKEQKRNINDALRDEAHFLLSVGSMKDKDKLQELIKDGRDPEISRLVNIIVEGHLKGLKETTKLRRSIDSNY